MFKFKYIVIVVFLLSLTFSCKTKKGNLIKIEKLEMSKLYDNGINSNINYESLLIKFNLKYNNSKKSIGLKGTAKIRKDSVIIVSLIAVLGIEAAKIKFTKDSLYIIDRLNSTVKKGNYQYLKKTFNIDLNYSDLQSILTNDFFVYPRAEFDKQEFVNNFKFRKDTNYYAVYRKLPNSVENLLKIDKNDFKITDYLISDIAQNRSLKIKYIDKFSKEISKIAKKVNISSTSMNKITNINLTYNKLTINKKLRYSFKIPSNYKLKVY